MIFTQIKKTWHGQTSYPISICRQWEHENQSQSYWDDHLETFLTKKLHCQVYQISFISFIIYIMISRVDLWQHKTFYHMFHTYLQNIIIWNAYADWDWIKFIQHIMTEYRCSMSDTHDIFFVLFSTDLILITNLHVSPPLRSFLVIAYA